MVACAGCKFVEGSLYYCTIRLVVDFIMLHDLNIKWVDSYDVEFY